jgi:biopolymer transport protein ExbD
MHHQRRLRRGRTKQRVPQLRMTSMMDILTVLLLFLLKSFVVDAEVVTPAPGVQLPESSSRTTPEETLVIAIAHNQVTVGNELVATVEPSATARTLLIPPLAERLQASRRQSMELRRLRGDTEPFEAKVTIQGDRGMPFQVLQKVMYTCNQSGFDNISLAVLQS